MASHRALLDRLWPSDSALQKALAAQGVEITASAIGNWRIRDDIPALHWPALVKATAASGESLTLDDLASSQKRLRTKAGAA